MSYFAAATVRGSAGWSASDIDLRGITDVEEAADRLRDLAEGDLGLLFVEADDEYLVILRLDENDDLRVFGSDAGYAEESALGAALLGDLEPERLPDLDDDESEDDRPAADPDSNPVGDADLLGDLGIPAVALLKFCAQEGMLPSEVTAKICETLGCADEVEELR
ncbi:tRNA adenosine deaminase-associated protein [Longispora albida]|uniref:tRNA adenosine deaminase-associated protein n=1 Tax=Longispora albida TaxID=203523 RepID=UPI0003A3FBAB|nr:tRNA adenosine deaminase-associated protein [Longispora albida]